MNLYEEDVYASEHEDHYWRALDILDPPTEWTEEFYPELHDTAPPF